jgi:hypothetical protein
MARISLKPFIWVLLLTQAVLIVVSTSRVSAQSASGSTITTSPVSVSLSTAPGSTTSTNLQVQNNGPSPVTISLKLDEFKAEGLSGKAQIYTPPTNDIPAQWVHFSKNSFTAQPGVWNSVAMTITTPKTAAFGYYYAVLFVPGLQTTATSTNTNKVKGANAVLVLLDAHTPNEKTELNVQSFSVDKTTFQYLPASFSVNVHNSGQIYTVPRGDIYISRTLNGKTIDTLDINSGEGNVLPGTNRVFKAQWSNGFPYYELKRVNGQIVSDKNGVPEQQLKWNITNISNFRYGKYYAHLILVYNNGSRDVIVNGVVTFWVIPWLALVGVLIFIGLIGIGLYSIVINIVKRFRKLRKRK